MHRGGMRVSAFALAFAAADEFFQVGPAGFVLSSARTGPPGLHHPVAASFAQAQAAPVGGSYGETRAPQALRFVGGACLVAACAVAGFAVGRAPGLTATSAGRAAPSPRMQAGGDINNTISEMQYRKEKAERDAQARAARAEAGTELRWDGWVSGGRNDWLAKQDDDKPRFGQMDDYTRFGGGALVDNLLYGTEGADTEFKRSDNAVERAIKRKPIKSFNKATGKVELRTFDGKPISTDYPTAELLALGGSGAPEIPVGDAIWDPLGLASPLNGPQVNKIYWYRQAEIKHGRVAMAACVGWFFPKVSGMLPFLKSVPGAELKSDPLETWASLPDSVKVSFVLTVGVIEFFSEREGVHYMRGGKLGVGKVPLGWDPLNLLKLKGDEESKRLSRLSELKNGRLAMIGIASIYAHSQIPGSVPALSYFNL